MKSVLLASVATLALVSASFAAELGAEVSVDVTTNAADDLVATPSIELSIGGDLANGSLSFAEDNGSLVLDGYSVGVTFGAVALSFGDQGDVFDAFEGGLETVGGLTLSNPDDSAESFIASVGTTQVMFGLTDISTDLMDVKNIQVVHTALMGETMVSGGVDYNLDTEETVFGLAASHNVGVYTLGGVLTYASATEALGYELNASAYGIKGFIDGDDTDALQNIGLGYTGTYQSATYYVEAAYNFDAKELTPAMGVAFKF